MPNLDVTHFTTVDHTSDPGFFLHFLDEANKLPAVVEWKHAILDALRLQPGMQALDLGCGMGTDAFDLATRVGPTGHVTGVDFSELLIAEAVRRSAIRNLPVTFEIGDAQALRFPDQTFDAVRTERMLMHVPNPEKAISEMTRVLRPGGRMAVLDMDWDTQFCDSPYKETTRKIVLSFSDSMKNGWIGRRLPRMFREAGMTDVAVSFRIARDDLRVSATAARRPHLERSLRRHAIGKRSRPLVDPPSQRQRRRNIPLRLHRIHRFRHEALAPATSRYRPHDMLAQT